MSIGKLPTSQLQQILRLVTPHNRSTLQGGKVGGDCAVIEHCGKLLVSSDPITCADISHLGELAICVASNDIYAARGKPIAITLTLILPTSCDFGAVERVMRDASNKCKELDIDIIGGHTEYSSSVTRPIICATAIGEYGLPLVPLRVGDSLIVTKTLGIEGSVILGSRANLTTSEQEDLASYLGKLSIAKEAQACSKLDCISLSHDITEGGLFGAIIESVSPQGTRIDCNKVPLTALTSKIAKQNDINPYQLISSGSLLLATASPQVVLDAIRGAGIQAVVIGEVTAAKHYAIINGKQTEITEQPDEITRAMR